MKSDTRRKRTVPSPDYLLDTLLEKLGLPNDSSLADALEVQRSVISKIRNDRARISGFVLLRIHEVSQIGIRELRDMMGDRSTGLWNGFQREVAKRRTSRRSSPSLHQALA